MSVWSSLYFPMAVMSVAVWRSFAAVSPHVVLPAIFRIPGQHLLMAGMVWLTWLGYELAAGHLAGQLRSAGILGELAGTFVPFLLLVYFSWVIARIIGITHWVYRKRIGWFRTI